MIYSADFETTTNPNDCRVWACGLCSVDEKLNYYYGNTIDWMFQFLLKNKENHTLYFHNLKFDGEFILKWLFDNGYKHVLDKKDYENKTFTTLISDMGVFYAIEICFEKRDNKYKKNHIIKIYDSLKLLPMGVDKIAKTFNLEISKLEIDYDEERKVGHMLTHDEIEYLQNDVTIVAIALRYLFSHNLNKMTTGSNALQDYKNIISKDKFIRDFPTPSYDSDIRQAYKGGFTYLNPKFKNKDLEEGIVLDVNSLYPSVMYYKPLPYGEGIFFEGKYEDDKIYNLYIQHFACQFELKKEYIPTIQIKRNLSFIPTEYVSTSNGQQVQLCMTNIDMELFFKHYDVYDIQYYSGWKFKSSDKLFRKYIDKWNEIKVKSTLENNSGMRQISKLMLNSLYGKFATNPNVRENIPYLDDGIVKYRKGEQQERKPVYLPVGCFVTSWARYITTTSAQKVYDRFVYADTDSLHLIGTEIPKGLEISDTELGKWKVESHFKRARFLHSKCYIEDIYNKDNSTNLKITCAGMPSRCYDNVTWENFHPLMQYEGKLRFKHVKGGIVLVPTTHTLKDI